MRQLFLSGLPSRHQDVKRTKQTLMSAYQGLNLTDQNMMSSIPAQYGGKTLREESFSKSEALGFP